MKLINEENFRNSVDFSVAFSEASLYVRSGVSHVELSFFQQTAHLRRGFAFDGTADKELFKLL